MQKTALENTSIRPGYDLRHGRLYRSGLVLQVLGTALLAVLYPIENPFYTAGIMLFEAGVLTAALFLVVSIRAFKVIIVGCAAAGLILQGAGFFIVPEQYAGSAIMAGVGLVCAAASGIAGKEAYCFGYREGWLLALAGFPALVLANFFLKENRIANSLGFSAAFLLLLSLTGKKLRQRPPEKNQAG